MITPYLDGTAEMYQTHNVRAFTPQSDFSLEPQQSLVDMTLPRDVRTPLSLTMLP